MLKAAVDAALPANRVKACLPPLPTGRTILSGGETTVAVRGHGRGGRNTEFQLGLALAIDSEPGIWALAADTDGVDGSEDNAGAIVSPDTLLRARALRRRPQEYLDDNDAYSFFAELRDLVITGPTLTNVNDFRRSSSRKGSLIAAQPIRYLGCDFRASLRIAPADLLPTDHDASLKRKRFGG
jgi:glycerate-2-kinase